MRLPLSVLSSLYTLVLVVRVGLSYQGRISMDLYCLRRTSSQTCHRQKSSPTRNNIKFEFSKFGTTAPCVNLQDPARKKSEMMATWLHPAGKCTEHDQRWPAKASQIDRLASRTIVLRGSFEERTARGRSRGYLFLKHFVVVLLKICLSILKELPLTPANKPCKDSDWFMNPFLSTNVLEDLGPLFES